MRLRVLDGSTCIKGQIIDTEHGNRLKQTRLHLGQRPPITGIMVAAMTKGANDVRIMNIPLSQDTESAYVAYVDDKLARIGVVNMVECSYTSGADSSNENNRPKAKYSFH